MVVPSKPRGAPRRFPWACRPANHGLPLWCLSCRHSLRLPWCHPFRLPCRVQDPVPSLWRPSRRGCHCSEAVPPGRSRSFSAPRLSRPRRPFPSSCPSGRQRPTPVPGQPWPRFRTACQSGRQFSTPAPGQPWPLFRTSRQPWPVSPCHPWHPPPENPVLLAYPPRRWRGSHQVPPPR
jgi:hypothetical protein